MNLSKSQKNVLRALIQGSTLKSHRYLDGTKLYKLHPLDGPAQTVEWNIVDALKSQGLIHSNQKFPAATYLLTDKGKELASTLEGTSTRPLSAKNYFRR